MSLSHLLLDSNRQWAGVAMLIFRVTLGVCFIVHGLGKLGIVGPGNMSGFTGWLKSLGVPAPALQARIAMLSELIGGALIACGLLTRVAALFCMVAMIVAALIGHKGGGYLITNNPPGNEYALNLAILMIVLIMIGPGHYSLDALLFAGR
ncbi:MAG: DoxX family protein [Verrucomicrobiota bacterium]|nr:DoxX family protein [Verrucomicrobiota bacterium]